jgi:S-formylglutathione hydrolase
MRTKRPEWQVLRLAAALLIAAGTAAVLFSQTTDNAKHGTVDRITVHGKGLEGKLEGDSPDREVLVYLPASYKISASRRYPVVYFLHGFTDDPDHWWGFKKHFINLPEVLDKAFSDGSTKETLVVMPNSHTAFQGSMYSNSVTTGAWEDYVSQELVAYIDAHYRTLANDASRGLAGHSMGGYGALKIGMKHPEIYSSLYVMSPCCLSAPNPIPAGSGGRGGRAEEIHSLAEAAKADFGTAASLSEAAAWSPNPKNPPLYLDVLTKDGQVRPEIAAKWAASAPLAMIDQYIINLRKLRGFAMDVGLQDGLARDLKVLDGVLNNYDLAHTYETYEGDHLNHVADRIQTRVMPFFSKNLSFKDRGI